MTREQEIKYWSNICKNLVDFGCELDLESLQFPYIIKGQIYTPILTKEEKLNIYNKIKKGVEYNASVAL